LYNNAGLALKQINYSVFLDKTKRILNLIVKNRNVIDKRNFHETSVQQYLQPILIAIYIIFLNTTGG